MSLINDMLRDLETRRSDELKRQNLQGEIRPLPAEPPRSWAMPLLFAGAVIVVLVAGLFWWFSAKPAPQPLLAASVLPPLPKKVTSTAMPTTTTLPERPVAVVMSTTTTLPVLPKDALSAQPESKKKANADVALVAPVKGSTVPVAVSASEKPVKVVSSALVVGEIKQKPAEAKPTAVVVEKPVKTTAVSKEKSEAAANIEVKTVISTPRERADADYRSAQTMLSGGRLAEAVDALRTALKHDPEYTPARQLLIRQLIEQRRVDEAIAALAEGLEQQPRQTPWAMSLARLQVEKNDLAAAERTLARYAAHAAGNAEYAGFHAHVQYRLGHFREAVALYQNATRIAAGEGRWWFGLGVALEGDGRSNEAREAFRQALATGTLNAELSALAMQRIR